MFRGIFVTGTDTGVGKTVVSAALLHRYRHMPIRYWKPIQTGIEQDDDTAEVQRLSGCGPEKALNDGIRLRVPVSPHVAARLSGSVIDVQSVVAIAAAQSDTNSWIVEGAGGILVPLNDHDLLIDLVSRLALSALVVSRSSLGTINHTLLTIEALERRGVPIAGVVMVGPPNLDNRQAIERYGRVRIIGEMPPLDPLVPEVVGRWADGALDTHGCLAELLT